MCVSISVFMRFHMYSCLHAPSHGCLYLLFASLYLFVLHFAFLGPPLMVPSVRMKYVFLFRRHVFTESENAKNRAIPRDMSNQARVQHCHPLSEEDEQEEKEGVQELMMVVVMVVMVATMMVTMTTVMMTRMMMRMGKVMMMMMLMIMMIMMMLMMMLMMMMLLMMMMMTAVMMMIMWDTD